MILADDESHEIPVWVLRPAERRHNDVLLFLHGGGWVTGDIESYTPACSALADATGRVVLSVDYRLAPEHPFPAGFDDCFRVAEVLLRRAGAARPGRCVPDNPDRRLRRRQLRQLSAWVCATLGCRCPAAKCCSIRRPGPITTPRPRRSIRSAS